ncbi:hypothetical protein Sjap_012145 [Stephania japonica]|uniref:AMP-activated protein kinase glycogen-binding domain-containing protein n=1 Tax=Stephania japonica TaxID=461633 RepID=A0AAP0NXB7_9MAGN
MDLSNPQRGIPTLITWSYGGNSVAVEGSWDNWSSRKILQRTGKDHSLLLVLPSVLYKPLRSVLLLLAWLEEKWISWFFFPSWKFLICLLLVMKFCYSFCGSSNFVRLRVRFTSDKRGWLINPIRLARDSGLSGVALSCASVHVGQIRPGGIRGNHRHHICNETFIIWGAETKFRLENPKMDKGYAEASVGAEEVAVASSSSGTAHALVNVDPIRPTFFLGCQDSSIAPNSSTTDFNIWKDL